jgi:hypothetical protein
MRLPALENNNNQSKSHTCVQFEEKEIERGVHAENEAGVISNNTTRNKQKKMREIKKEGQRE